MMKVRYESFLNLGSAGLQASCVAPTRQLLSKTSNSRITGQIVPRGSARVTVQILRASIMRVMTTR